MLTRATERPAPDDARDGGFTLTELLISISILGLIMGAVTSAIIISLTQLSSTQTRLDDSNDLRLVASRFSTDVAGGNRFETADTTATASACGGVAATSTVLEITGATFNPDAPPANPATALTASITTYVTAAGTAPGSLELHRLTCTSGPSGTASTTQVLARGLGTPTVTCTNAAGTTVACDNAAAAVVRAVLTPASGDSQLVTTLVGRRRTT